MGPMGPGMMMHPGMMGMELPFPGQASFVTCHGSVPSQTRSASTEHNLQESHFETVQGHLVTGSNDDLNSSQSHESRSKMSYS